MAEKVEIDIEVNSNIEPSIKALKELKKQLKETAAGSDEFKRISKNIKDVEDSLEESRAGAKGFVDMLEEAPGPLGQLFGGLRKAEIATKGFGTALKATGIGLIVAAIGGLVAAFSNVEGATKKLEPLMIGFEKILGGIFAALEPLIDSFLELATAALPYITKGIGIFYSTLVGLFNLVKNVGVGVGQILKGIFTLDFDSVSEGYDKIKNAIPAAMDAGKAAFGRYEEGTKRLTKTEKENLKERGEANKNALEEKKKQMEAQDKLDEAALEKLKAEALAVATTEQEKFDIEKGFAEKLYQLKLKDLNDRLALEKKGSAEYKNILAEITKLQADKLASDTDFAAKGKEIAEKAAEDLRKANEEARSKAELDLELQKEKGLLDEAEYEQALYDMRVKYANSNEELVKAEIDLLKFKNDEKKKLAEEERQTALNNIQAQFEDLDRANKQSELDFAQDLERLAQQKELLSQQEAVELQNEELTEFQKTEIRKKYADARRAISDQEIATEKAAQQAKHDINMAYLGLFEQFGSLLGQIAGKNAGLAIAGVIIQQAAAIGQIIASTGIANAKSVAASPLTAGMPWVAINTISAGLSIASTIASAVKSIQQIKQQAAQAGASGGTGGGSGAMTAPSIPTPRVAGAAAPQINTTGGMNPSTQISETIASAQNRPIRAYVVSGEVSSAQAMDRRVSNAATFSGG
jgi:hypothetical protein